MPDLTRKGNLWAAAQQLGLRRTSKKGETDQEDPAKEVVANRKLLRSKGYRSHQHSTVGRPGWPRSSSASITSRRLAPPSIDVLIAVHQVQPDGTTRKYVIQRDRVDGVDQRHIFKGRV